jgi:hypothetical protein
MSCIKRDVKKKAQPRPEIKIVSRDPAHSSFASLEKFWFVVHARKFPLLMVAMPSSLKELFQGAHPILSVVNRLELVGA